jgi:putative NIF3 family GTP cyclohydrolase 1 type 2
LELAPGTNGEGLGRIGVLAEPVTLGAFTKAVAEALPVSMSGVRAAGDPEQSIRTVAVCGGAGDSLLGVARAAGADAYVTGDLRHHPVDEHLRGGGPALIDAEELNNLFAPRELGAPVAGVELPGLSATVFANPTDPWTIHRGGLGG